MDLYYLLRYILHRTDVEKRWLFERCREVQNSPDGHLDLWSREHYKSTIITYAKTIQDILASHGRYPLPEWDGREVTVGIFSHTRPRAKDFLRMIKYEFEANNELRELFPDIIWSNCERDSPKWSEDDGLVLKRRTNPREATVEAHGLVDGMPTGKHFFLMVYDDVVTEKSVTSPDMIKKTTQAWELSRALGTEGGRTRYIGTRYHYFDTYYDLIKRKAGEVRMYPATKNGRFDGKPVLWSRQFLNQRVREMGPYVAACQLMQDPAADSAQGFQVEWLKYHDIDPLNGWHSCKRMNRYLLVDPANEKKKTSDRTAMAVIALGEDGNYYLVDFIWDRLNLDERTQALFYLHKLWRPKKTGYERYGKDSDIDHIKYVQSLENYRFEITPLAGPLGNIDRVRRLIPVFSQGKFYIPKKLWRTDYEGRQIEMIEQFVNDEYVPFPVGHVDLLDIMSRVLDDALAAKWPKLGEEAREARYAPDSRSGAYAGAVRNSREWMSA